MITQGCRRRVRSQCGRRRLLCWSLLAALHTGAALAQEAADAAAAATSPSQAPPSEQAAPEPYEKTVPVPQPSPEPVVREREHAAVQLEEVVVTATKREKSLREIPASIAAVQGRDLERKGVLSINEVLDQIPGVTSNSSRPGDQRVIMRGISTTAAATSTTPYPVGIFVGDTAFNEPYAASITPDLSAFDLQSVEILKGPQGTLFGGAALAGAIRYRLNDPVPGMWQARAFSQYTQLEEGSEAWTHGAAVNVPLGGEGGSVGLRLGYIHREYPGAYDDLRPEQAAQDVDAGSGEQYRAGLLWEPSHNAHVKLTYLDQDYAADNGLVITDYRNGPRATRASLLPWPNRHRFSLYNLELQYDWDTLRLVSSSSRTEKQRYNSIDSVGVLIGIPPPGTPEALGIPFIADQWSNSFQQEVRLQSTGGGSLEWLVGAYFYRAPIHYYVELSVQGLNDVGALGQNAGQALADLNQLISGLLGPDNLLSQLVGQVTPALAAVRCEVALLCAETNAKARERALFFDVAWKPWRMLEISVGARYYLTEVAGGFVGTGLGARLVNGGVSPADFRATIDEEGVNPKLAVTLRPLKNVSLYALANKGFRFGGIQNIPADPAQGVPETYKSDSIWNYELGLRTSWLANTLQADITGFHIDYQDPLVVLKNGLQINYYDNAGSAESDGFEARLRWLTPLRGVTLQLTGGTVDARTTEFFMAGNTPVPAGKALPGSAKVQYAAQLAWVGPPDWWLSLGTSAGYTYIGEAYAAINTDSRIYDYGVYDAGLILGVNRWPGRPSLSINLSNITDEAAPIAGEGFYTLNPPRTLVARFSLEFE
jgi:outer membrane receptor protein involved in Fe transport